MPHLKARGRVRRLQLSAFFAIEREAVAGLANNVLAEKTTPATRNHTGKLLGDVFENYSGKPLAVRAKLERKKGLDVELLSYVAPDPIEPPDAVPPPIL